MTAPAKRATCEADITTMTQEEARHWLIANDREAADYWAGLPADTDFREDVRVNCRDFGYDEADVMKQQVDITLKLSLWLDASMDEDDIVTHIRAALPLAFRGELTEMRNPVDILDVKQEAEIYGNEEEPRMVAAYTAYQLADDPAAYGPDAGKFIVTGADHNQEYSGPMAAKDATAFAAALSALDYLLEQTVDQDMKYGIELTEGEKDARQQALAVFGQVKGRAA